DLPGEARRALVNKNLPAAGQPSADPGAVARGRLDDASALALVLVLDGGCRRCFCVCGSIEHVVCRGFDRPAACPSPRAVAEKDERVAGRHYYRTSAAQSGALFALTLLAAARPV